MQPATEAPVSILDIVTYGFKKAVQAFWPVSWLCLPALVCLALGGAVIESVPIDDSVIRVKDALYKPLSLIVLYMNYAIARYARDVFWSEPKENLWTYMIPDRTLWGVCGIGVLTVFYGMGAGLLGMLGLLLLVIPGIAIFSYYYVWSGMFYTVYLRKPEAGVWSARHETARLFKGNFWRTAGLGLVVSLVSVLPMLPMVFLSGGMEILREMPPSFMPTYAFSILYGILYAAIYWVSLGICFSGFSFVLNRYYQELQSRLEQSLSGVVQMSAFQQQYQEQDRQSGS